jgi:hypothetical protein
MLRKEIRENWKWAALGTFCLTFAELYALYQPSSYNAIALASPTFVLITICGSVLIGAALGALQILPELDRDRWAALLHRPISRSTLFLGKIIAGLILYLLATGIPMLFSIAFFAMPGQFASPFLPALLPPAIANAFLGVVFYAAAVLVSLTRGHWYGKRTLLVMAVLPLLIIIPGSPWIFLPTLFTTALLLTAAWGTMTGNGIVRPGLRAAEFSLGLLLFVGIEAAFGIFLLGLNYLPGADSHAPPSAEYRNLVVMMDGKVFLNINRIGKDHRALYELDSTPLTNEKYVGNEATVSTITFYALSSDSRSFRDLVQTAQIGDPHALQNFVDIAYDFGQGIEYWYYLVDKGYFVGYDKLTRRRIGICDREGFHPPGSIPHPFPKPVQMPLQTSLQPNLVWIDGQLYGLDFPDRGLLPLFTAPNGRIHAAEGIMGRSDNVLYFAIALDKAIQILTPQGKPVVTIPYHQDVVGPQIISVAAIPSGDRIFVKYDPDSSTPASGGKAFPPTIVDEVDLQGTVRHSFSIPTTHFDFQAGWAEYVAYAGAPFLPTAIIGLVAESKEMSTSTTSTGKSNSMRMLLLIAAGLGAVAAAIAFRWARRAGLARNETIGWLAFVFCFGLPGLLAFRLTARFPTRVRCPNCSRQRPLQTEHCPSCHQAWPTPVSSGTEIFAELGC